MISSCEKDLNKQKKSVKSNNSEISINYTPVSDSISDNFDNTEQILLERVGLDEIWVYNCFNSGFTGSLKLIKVKSNLKIKAAYYDYWTDHIELDNQKYYKVKKSEINFEKNPFETNELVNIEYKLIINEVAYKSDKISDTFTINEKIKSIELNSEKVRDFKEKYGIINSFNSYQIEFLDIKPKLKTSLKSLKNVLRTKFEKVSLMTVFSIYENGEVISSSIKIRTSKKMNLEQKKKLKKMIEKLKYSVPQINKKPVRAQISLNLSV